MGASILEQLAAEVRELDSGRGYGGGSALQRSFGSKAALTTGGSPSTPSSPYMHGPGGLFGVAGLERDVISTRIHPYGLGSELPARGTVVTNPLFPYITSFGAPTGNNPVGVCDDAQEAGPVATCIQTAQFGNYTYQTRTLDIVRNGQQTNRGEFLDLRIYNDPLLDRLGGNDLLTPNVPGNPPLVREVLQRFVEVGIAFQNKLVGQTWLGNPANNTSGGGYQEFAGLDMLIGVNKFDALSGTACPALNSDVKNFNYENITTSSTGGTNMVNVMSYLLRYLKYNAEHMNLAPVDWSIAMRPELWWEVSGVWPCSYMTYRCQQTGVLNNLYIDTNDQMRMRDDMRQNMYLLIDGIKYPVILDTGITEETSTTQNKVTNASYASDIYIVPRTIRGGLASTYWEFLDYQQTAMVALSDGGPNVNDFWTDGGRYLWHRKPPANRCIQWQAWMQPRIVLLTPQLAGKVLNVAYKPLQHTQEPINTEPYFVGGGVTSRPGPSLYSDWAH